MTGKNADDITEAESVAGSAGEAPEGKVANKKITEKKTQIKKTADKKSTVKQSGEKKTAEKKTVKEKSKEESSAKAESGAKKSSGTRTSSKVPAKATDKSITKSKTSEKKRERSASAKPAEKSVSAKKVSERKVSSAEATKGESGPSAITQKSAAKKSTQAFKPPAQDSDKKADSVSSAKSERVKKPRSKIIVEVPEIPDELGDLVGTTDSSLGQPVQHAPRGPLVSSASGVGRRKSAVARVYLSPGQGGFIVNGRNVNDYFPNKTHRQFVREPLKLLELSDSYNVTATLRGGGSSGQAGALRMGIARALNDVDPENNRKPLKAAGLLTRDSRIKERKKAGLKKARKAPQYSKR